MTERPWTIDAGVARDLAEALGWRADDGVAALAQRFPERIPVGSTAKVAAVVAGEAPPGEAPDGLARRILEHQLAVAAGPEGGAPSPSWSCWVLGTVFAALVERSGLGPADVAALRRIDDRSPVVDLHAAVRVPGEGGATWICDPYFGVAVELPAGPGASAAAEGELAEVGATRGDATGWTFQVRIRRWDAPLRYRLLGPALDAGDVRALAVVSVTHSGVPTRPYARLHVDGAVVDASEAEDGTGRLAAWSRGAGPEELLLPTWAAANDRFALRTGTRIT